VTVTACAPSCNSASATTLTISPGLYLRNWRSSQSTGAFWATTTAQQQGVEDLSMDLSALTGTSTVILMNCNQCWVKGIRSLWAARSHIMFYTCAHCEVRDSYFFESTSHNSVSYGMEIDLGSDNLIVNNICQRVTDSCPNSNGGGTGNVAAYNFAVADIFNGTHWFQPSDYEHSSGQSFWLREGNISLGLDADDVHGTHMLTTAWRNRFAGWQSAGCGGLPGDGCTSDTTAVIMFGASRYFNFVGNVAGMPGFHTNYINLAPAGNQNLSVYYLGGTHGGVFCANPTCSSTVSTFDPLTQTSILLWGNWDNVNNAVRFQSSEVPSSLADTTGSPSIYANAVPATQTIPASLLYTAVPSWWGSLPWPGVGPDVVGGNVGLCAGGTYDKSQATQVSQCSGGGTLTTAFGGHVNANPAMRCALQIMGMAPDGTGGPPPFNRVTCYGP
jgi:hypothetical protein